MPQVIYMPRDPRKDFSGLGNALVQGILLKKQNEIRRQEREEDFLQKAQLAGYTTEPPEEYSPEQMEKTPAGPRLTALTPTPTRKPDLTVGGKPLWAPRTEIGKPINLGGGYSAIPIMQNGRVVNYEMKKGEPLTTEQTLMGMGLLKVGNDVFRPKLNQAGKVELEQVTQEGDKSYQYNTITLQPPQEGGKPITLRRTSPEVDRYLKLGYTESKTPAVQVNMGKDLTQGMKTELQKTIKESEDTLDFIDRVSRSYDPSYSTAFGEDFWDVFKGKGATGASATAFIERKFPSMPSEQRKEYLKKFTNWANDVKQQNFLYRKMITGVAGGAQEMERIEAVAVNPKDSQSVYKAKTDLQRYNALRARDRARFALDYFGQDITTLSNEQRQQIAEKYPFASDIKDIIPGGKSNVPKPMTPEEEADAYLKSLGR